MNLRRRFKTRRRVSPEQISQRSPRTGQLARCHFVQYQSQREQVGTPIERFTTYLLRGSIGRGAGKTAGLRQHRKCVRAGTSGLSNVLGNSKVQDLDQATLGDEDICGFDVAVDD